MKVRPLGIEGPLILEPEVFGDERGYFFESYNKRELERLTGQGMNFVQDNESCSFYGVIRGLHYQKGPYAQTKLVRVLQGTIYDVFVDIREDSPTFLRWEGVELSAENRKQVLIPKGFAHGFSVLSEKAVVAYKCDAFYEPSAETGIAYDDPVLGIDWKLNGEDVVLSDKDRKLGYLEVRR